MQILVGYSVVCCSNHVVVVASIIYYVAVAVAAAAVLMLAMKGTQSSLWETISNAMRFLI